MKYQVEEIVNTNGVVIKKLHSIFADKEEADEVANNLRALNTNKNVTYKVKATDDHH